MKAMCSESRET